MFFNHIFSNTHESYDFFMYLDYNWLFKFSFYNQRVDISAPVYIVFVDFVQSTNWFRGVRGCNPVFSSQFVFRACELGLCWYLNEGYIWDEIVQMCMQYILAATHIDTFDEVFIVLRKNMHIWKEIAKTPFLAMLQAYHTVILR